MSNKTQDKEAVELPSGSCQEWVPQIQHLHECTDSTNSSEFSNNKKDPFSP